MAIIGLLDSPTLGQHLFKQKPVENLDISERAVIRNREIGFIFQSFNLLGDLTTYENVELPLTYRSMGDGERKQRVQQALERVEMSHRAKHYPSQLSGGQQQRVAVARALAGSPSILLADEPTGNLDSRNANSVMDLLQELHTERQREGRARNSSRTSPIYPHSQNSLEIPEVENSRGRAVPRSVRPPFCGFTFQLWSNDSGT